MEFEFSKKADSFQAGIFAILNEKKEEMVKAGKKFIIFPSAHRISSRHLISWKLFQRRQKIRKIINMH